jgi:hypothetical protein
MATVKDGIKLGCGYALFRGAMGFLSVVATIAVVLWIVSADKKSDSPAAKPEPAAPTSSEATHVRYAMPCRVRSRPSTDADVIGTAEAGKPYAVLDQEGSWRRIRIGGSDGWCVCETE